MDRSEEFVQRTEPFRRELLAHCYRMLGSADEVEDLVQETYLRAWRSYGTFEDRSSVRTWLYRIATNACLTALEQHVRLALIASLQYLPARQRAVLLLREVLGFSAAEVAAMLATSTVAVKSTLQRARARLDEVAPAPESVIEPTEPHARELLARYIAGFENADITALEKSPAHRRRDRTCRHPHLVLRPRDVPALPGACDRVSRRLADDAHPGQRPARRGRLSARRRQNPSRPRSRRPHRHPGRYRPH